LHRRFFRRPFCERIGRHRRWRAGGAKHRRDRRLPRQRLPPQTEAAQGIALGTRPIRARLLFACAARPCRRPRRAGVARGWPVVLCRRGHLAKLFLHRARRAGQWGKGGGVGGGLTQDRMTGAFRSFVIAGLDPAIYPSVTANDKPVWRSRH
jgi:hypothetical protein